MDELRELHPELGLSLYALTPGGTVTLEILTPDQEIFSFIDLTEAAAIAQAFPAPAPVAPPPPPEPKPSVFD